MMAIVLTLLLCSVVFWGGLMDNNVYAGTWTYIGNCTSYSGGGTSELTFTCGTPKVRVKACAPNVIKVWCESSGTFSRNYNSFAIQNEALNPVNLTVTDNGTYYEFATSEVKVRAYKQPFRLQFYDISTNLLTKNTSGKGMGWSSTSEVGVWNDLPSDEHFWGLGEKKESFDKRGQKIYQWAVDLGGADSLAPADGEGRWYGANPHFLSSKGYSIYFDNTSRTCFDMGKSVSSEYSFAALDPAPGGEMIYYLIYGPTPKKIVKTFTDMTGKSFFPPKWALGNGQCHWGYKQTDILNVASTYRSKNIPCDIMWADIEWYKEYCTPRAWNPTNFPDPQTMLNTLTSSGFKMGVIDDPNVTSSAADYTTGNSNGYFVKGGSGTTSTVSWPWGGTSGVVDFFNPSARTWWGGLHNHLVTEGVDCFWCDMNEPARYNMDWNFYNESGGSRGNLYEMHNAFAQMHHKTIFDWFKSYANRRPFILTRSFFTGSHRYAAPWSGDTSSDWNTITFHIRMGTSFALSGFNFWAFDIGGFSGNPTDDQFKRWVELAAFSPLHRFHYQIGSGPQEAWSHNAEAISKKYITQRERLIPYFYSCAADSIIGTGLETGYGSGGTGFPLMRAIVLEYPNDQTAYTLDSEFMCGPNFLVAPVTVSATTKQVYFPQGDWYDYSNGRTVYTGPQTITYQAPIDVLPTFAKAGAIIPMMPEMQYVGQVAINPLTLDIFPLRSNGTSSFILYEDDGDTFGYQSGAYCTTKYECTVNQNSSTSQQTTTLKLNARQQGSTGYNPGSRNYMLQFHSSNLGGLSVTKDGSALTKYSTKAALDAAASGWFIDTPTEICYVKYADTGATVNIVLSGTYTVTTPPPTSTPTPTPGPLPAPWVFNDIGNPNAGSASYNSGEFTINGGGADIEGTSDQFAYVHQGITGDSTMIARITSQTNTNPWAKAGLMFRETTNANSRFVDQVVTPSNGMALQYRSSTGGTTTHVGLGSYTFPVYLKLVRSGNTFTAYKSSDGVNWGSVLGSCTVTMTSAIKTGMCVTSHDTGQTSTVKYDNVSVNGSGPTSTPTPTPTPTPTSTPSNGKYEAENAALSGGASINNNHTGYSGTGFVDKMETVGSTVTFTVNVASAGNYNVTLRYANANTAARTISLYVNSSKIRQISLPVLANWDTWGDKVDAVSLNAGNNTIAYKYDSGDSAFVNLDYITVASGGATPTPTPTPAGTLSVTNVAPPASANLSTEGTTDWAHWGLTDTSSFNHKSGVTQQISNYTKIGSGTVGRFTDCQVKYSWTGGTPTDSATDTITGLYIPLVGNGFQFTVPAGTTQKTLKVYVSVYKARGKFEVSLSDGSAPAYTDYTDISTGSHYKVYTIVFKAGSASQTLTIKHTVESVYDASIGNVTLQAATLY